MKKVIIASDSTTDLTRDLIEKYDIRVLPLSVNLGGNTYLDGVDIDPDTIYEHFDKTGELPKTSAINLAPLYFVLVETICLFFATWRGITNHLLSFRFLIEYARMQGASPTILWRLRRPEMARARCWMRGRSANFGCLARGCTWE